MKAYAGIGSRRISIDESLTIIKTARKLNKIFTVYSGNADGSDITFQQGSDGNCVVFMPYKKFNIRSFDPWAEGKALDCFIGDTEEGREATDLYHPCPEALTWKTKPFMARNYHQVMGMGEYPQVEFVLCCANRDENGGVVGGTGHACKIAAKHDIPVVNIRDQNWKKDLKDVLTKMNIDIGTL